MFCYPSLHDKNRHLQSKISKLFFLKILFNFIINLYSVLELRRLYCILECVVLHSLMVCWYSLTQNLFKRFVWFLIFIVSVRRANKNHDNIWLFLRQIHAQIQKEIVIFVCIFNSLFYFSTVPCPRSCHAHAIRSLWVFHMNTSLFCVSPYDHFFSHVYLQVHYSPHSIWLYVRVLCRLYKRKCNVLFCTAF